MQSTQVTKLKLSDMAVSALRYLDRIGMALTTRSLLKKQGFGDEVAKELQKRGYIEVEEAANEFVIYAVNLEKVRRVTRRDDNGYR